MRPVLHSDLRMAARALMAVPAGDRASFCTRLLEQAELADRYTRRLGKLHPAWGNGTLSGAAQGHPLGRERSLDDPDYRLACQMILEGIAARRGGAAL